MRCPPGCIKTQLDTFGVTPHMLGRVCITPPGVAMCGMHALSTSKHLVVAQPRENLHHHGNPARSNEVTCLSASIGRQFGRAPASLGKGDFVQLQCRLAFLKKREAPLTPVLHQNTNLLVHSPVEMGSVQWNIMKHQLVIRPGHATTK